MGCHASKKSSCIYSNLEPKRINPINRTIADIPIKIHIPRLKPDRVGLEEPSERRAVYPVAIVVDSRVAEQFTACEQEAVFEAGNREAET